MCLGLGLPKYAVCVAFPAPAGRTNVPPGETGCGSACVNVEADSEQLRQVRNDMWNGPDLRQGELRLPGGYRNVVRGGLRKRGDRLESLRWVWRSLSGLGAKLREGRCLCPAADTVCSGACVDEETDPHNCGEVRSRMRRDLFRGPMSDRARFGGEPPRSVALWGTTTVYWTSAVGVIGVPLNGGKSFTVASAQASPLSVTVDKSSVYWTTTGNAPEALAL